MTRLCKGDRVRVLAGNVESAYDGVTGTVIHTSNNMCIVSFRSPVYLYCPDTDDYVMEHEAIFYDDELELI